MKTKVIADLVSKVDEKVAQLERKIKKNGGSLIYTKSEPFIQEDETDYHFERNVVEITLESNYVIEGYEFVASLEYVPELKTNLIKTAGVQDNIPEKYRSSNICEHCNTKRNRKHTVLLRNTETGEYKQVGNSCVKDYIGIKVENYLSYLSWFKSLEEYVESISKEEYSRGSVAFKVRDILEQTVAEVNQFGYISKQQSYDSDRVSTSSVIFCIFNDIGSICNREIHRYDITDSIKDTVNTVYDFINNVEPTADYERNLKTLLQLEYVTNKDLGLVVSAYGYYLRETAKKKNTESETHSEWVGEIGQRIIIKATPEIVTSFDTEWCWCYIYKFVQDGNVFIWKKSGLFGEYEPNGYIFTPYESEITFKATVVDHKVYNGVKQTIINRGKIIK